MLMILMPTFEESFKQFKEHCYLWNRKFDYIVLHGVWSWIGKENQKIIAEIMHKSLRVCAKLMGHFDPLAFNV